MKVNVMLKLGTVFSGIGAIEHALERLSIPHDIAFACDNGNIEIDIKQDENNNQNAFVNLDFGKLTF